MLKYKELRWGNCFSYGDDNTLSLCSAPITQLVGKNGHGKSSVALILEEVQFNKNSRGIKKGAILNRHGSAKSYWIELDFEKDGKEYTISTTRSGATQKVVFECDGEDISSHTATNTFKDIEEVLGFDHTTFIQIVYQSSADSLQFLTATDSQRKKFLIELFRLSRYGVALDLFKVLSTELSSKVAVLESTISKTSAWIAKYSSESLELKPTFDVPEQPIELEAKANKIFADKANISTQAKAIANNNTYKAARDRVILHVAPTMSAEEIAALVATIDSLGTDSIELRSNLTKAKSIKTKCPTCGATTGVDTEYLNKSITDYSSKLAITDELLAEARAKYLLYTTDMKKANDSSTEYEKYHSLWNPDLPTVAPSVEDLEAEYLAIQSEIARARKNRDNVVALNSQAHAHNARVDMLRSQLADMQEELDVATNAHKALVERAGIVAILIKAFSNTGLVAYKIECLVKDLENITNGYLGDLSDGRFLISFQISSSDKLNVIITDNGEDIELSALSTGERARVNVATLLAIRTLMQALSDTHTNLLIMDETIENLDIEGKEKLIERLLSEHDMNTFLISHSFTHPLIERLGVVKRNNISALEVI